MNCFRLHNAHYAATSDCCLYDIWYPDEGPQSELSEQITNRNDRKTAVLLKIHVDSYSLERSSPPPPAQQSSPCATVPCFPWVSIRPARGGS